jgi:hypothetical protein
MQEYPKTVHAALLAARREFDPVLKDLQNPHFKSKFASLSSVLAATDSALAKYGLCLIQYTRVRENGAVLLITELVHVETNGTISSEYLLTPCKPNDPQAMGGALTYARRYSALAILGVAPEDDDGETAAGRGRDRQKKPRRNRDQPTALDAAREALRGCKSLEDMRELWSKMPADLQQQLADEKDAAKARLGAGPTTQVLAGGQK